MIVFEEGLRKAYYHASLLADRHAGVSIHVAADVYLGLQSMADRVSNFPQPSTVTTWMGFPIVKEDGMRDGGIEVHLIRVIT